ncbi:response regulator transcription factor [Gorillibacterium sp. sgz5001074]|uniref:response regulator transcription factor n=1 Tax=Gorillibacterium sp. sgz5001074 TaxID=3446695 RepID=UPI003F6713A2
MIEILLVDDETYVTESLAETIPWTEIGVACVHQAASARDALSILEEQSVDILVTDIRMPEMDGLALIREVSARWPHVRCLVLTGHSDFEYAKKAIQLQVSDYILKPVDDGEFVTSVTNAIGSLKDEWEQAERYNQLLYHRKSDFSVLRANLMHELVLGRRLSPGRLRDKLSEYELPPVMDEHAVLLLIRLGRSFTSLDSGSVPLMEYAVGNIAEEVFGGTFHAWSCKAPHSCLLVLLSPKPAAAGLPDSEQARKSALTALVKEFRRNVSNYLKGELSVVITDWFSFPDGISGAYRTGLNAVFLSAQDEAGSVQFLNDRDTREMLVPSAEILYKPPTLLHLLESLQWEAARSKVGEVFGDLEAKRYTMEQLYGIFLSVSNAIIYIAHKRGLSMAQLDASGFDPILNPNMMHSLEQVRAWTFRMLDTLQEDVSVSDLHTKSYIVKQVQKMVAVELGQDLSVKTIADRVFLHPVYLSKIYKAETGESLGDYIIRMKMDKALYLLRHTNKKIYEITTELGYQNPQYFSKMFKKYTGMTPNEFRDQ